LCVYTHKSLHTAKHWFPWVADACTCKDQGCSKPAATLLLLVLPHAANQWLQDNFEEGNRVFIVEEYLPRTLADVVSSKGGVLEVETARRIARQLFMVLR